MDMRVRNESDEAIAALLDRTPAAVQSRASKLRRSGVALVPALRFWSAPEVEKVIMLYEAGATSATIAAEIGRSLWSVKEKVADLQDEGTIDGRAGGVSSDHVRRIPTADPLLAALHAAHGRSA